MADQVHRSSFSSSDPEEVTEFIRQMYAENTSRFAPIKHHARFTATTNDVPAIGTDRLQTSIDYDGTSAGFEDFITFFVVHAGAVTVGSPEGRVSSVAGDAAFFPLGVPLEFDMRGYDVTTLRLSLARLGRAAEDATGLPAGELRFADTRPVSASMLGYWRGLVGLVSAALTAPDSPMSSPLIAEDLARTVAVAAVHTFPNTTMTRQSGAGPGALTPAGLRRAVAYMEAHAERPLGLDEIATAARTSTRALQYAFRRHLDTTPLAYLRRIRLERARQDLQAADPTRGDSVAAIARRWGFANAGRFAAAYRSVYGVTPAHTLRH